MTLGDGGRFTGPEGGEFVESLPENLAMGIGLNQQFMPGAGHIHQTTVRCLAAEPHLGRAADDALRGGPYDEHGNVETAGERRRTHTFDRVEGRVQPPTGHPAERQARIGPEIGQATRETYRIAGEGIVFKNTVAVRVAPCTGSKDVTAPQTHRRADKTA